MIKAKHVKVSDIKEEVVKLALDDLPDPKMHFKISMYKSIIRIMSGAAFIVGGLWFPETFDNFIMLGGLGIIMAEILGIYEEMV
jgi:hypothetical protein